MIKFEHTEVVGWEHAIRGMRNPMNSWEKSDSWFLDSQDGLYNIIGDLNDSVPDHIENEYIGPNDLFLMKRLRNAGTDHRKFMRMITVYVDITAPLYWWKEFDTYKVGTVANSCSTMHKIAAKEFTLEDFSIEHLMEWEDYESEAKELKPTRLCNFKFYLMDTISALNNARDLYLQTNDKKYWWQMIQLLPSSYNQRRTVMLNYEVLANIYKSRQNHRLDEWCEHEEMVYKNYMDDVERESIEGQFSFCDWIESLPYSELITGPDLKATYSMKGVNNMSIEMDLKKVDEVEKVKMDTYAVTPRSDIYGSDA